LAVGSGRKGDGGFQVRDDLGDLLRVAPADLVHLLDELAVPLHEARVQPVRLAARLLERVGLLRRDTGVQVVRAGQQDVLAWSGGLVRDDGSTAGSKNIGARRASIASSVSPAGRPTVAPALTAVRTAGGKRLGRGLQHELAGRQVVVRPVVDPEQLGVGLDGRQRGRIDALRMRQHGLEHRPHLQRVPVLLVDEDVPASQGRLVEVPDERLVAERERVEAVGVELHDRRVLHRLQQVLPLGRGRGRLLGGRRRGSRGGTTRHQHGFQPGRRSPGEAGHPLVARFVA
jgi:hypothetical protein